MPKVIFPFFHYACRRQAFRDVFARSFERGRHADTAAESLDAMPAMPLPSPDVIAIYATARRHTFVTGAERHQRHSDYGASASLLLAFNACRCRLPRIAMLSNEFMSQNASFGLSV